MSRLKKFTVVFIVFTLVLTSLYFPATVLAEKEPVLQMASNEARKAPIHIACEEEITISPIKTVAINKNNSLYISPNTVITKDNIYDVLSYLGIDSTGFIRTDEENSLENITVGQLEDIISYRTMDSSDNEASLAVAPLRSIALSDNLTMPSAARSGIGYGTGTIVLRRVSDLDSYKLTYTCSAMYSGGRWTGIGNCDVTINESYLIAGIKYKITEKKNLSASMSTDKSKITMNSTVVVGAFLSVANTGLIPVNFYEVKATNYWYIKDYK